MKAILIDPFTREVRQVETDGHYTSIYPLLGITSPFDIIILNAAQDTLYVDDEGWLKPHVEQDYFWWQGYNQLLAGRGLILGTTPDGEAASTTFNVETVRQLVRWQDHSRASIYAPGPPVIRSF
jgi:hypothetical protein